MFLKQMIFCALAVTSFAHAADLTVEELNKLAIDNINRVIPAESYPGKCFSKYNVQSESKTGDGTREFKRPSPEEVTSLLNSGKSLDEIASALKAKTGKSTKVERTYAELEYKVGGDIRKEILFDLPRSVEGVTTTIENIALVLVHFLDRMCPKERAYYLKKHPPGQKAPANGQNRIETAT